MPPITHLRSAARRHLLALALLLPTGGRASSDSWTDLIGGRRNLAVGAKLTATRSNNSEVYKLVHATDGKLTTNADIQACESCWAGSQGDLRLDPIDFVIDWGEVEVIDRIVVATCHLKNQLRLTDFEVYGWAGTDWDGAHPLASVRGADEEVSVCSFEPIATSKICLRLLDNTRPNHDFPHVSEVAALVAEGRAKQKLAPTGLPPRLSELKTTEDCQRERDRLRRLLADDAGNDSLTVRLAALGQKLRLAQEQERWRQRLDAIDGETRDLLAAGVPEWAAAQSEALRKYVLWIHWWIEHQQPDGEFGGTFNDDVELVCGWPLACFAASDRKTFDSLALLGESVWNWGPISKHAYSTYTDVEHSAEEISYSQPRMVLLEPDEPRWAERCARSSLAVRDLFMAKNGAGRLQFRSQWFGIRGDKPVIDETKAYGIPECAKALKPALYAAFRGDEACRGLCLAYGDTWLRAAMTATPEKPAGLLPASLDFRTGEPRGLQLGMPPMRAMHYHLLGCYLLSGDSKYLEPARAVIDEFLVKRSINDLPYLPTGDHGEATACASQFGLLCSMWRRLTGDRSFDERFARWARRLVDAMGDGYEAYYYMDRTKPELWIRIPAQVGAFRLPRRAIGPELYAGWLATGDKRFLAAACYNLSRVLTDQWDALTAWFYDKTETRVTSNDHLAHSLQCAASTLMMMYTGWSSPVEGHPPNNAVTWEGTTPKFAALVLETTPTKLRLLACNLEREDRRVTMRVHGLGPGSYRLTIGLGADGDDRPDLTPHTEELKVDRDAPVGVMLPAWSTTLVTIESVGARRP